MDQATLAVAHLYGRSENAVRCQIWCAICAYLMVAILKQQLGLKKRYTKCCKSRA